MRGSSRLGDEAPTATDDAESAERTRWIIVPADLLRGTKTPMGRLLAENPVNVQMLEGGLRASTVRARVRCIRRFLAWLAAQQELIYPKSLQHLTDF